MVTQRLATLIEAVFYLLHILQCCNLHVSYSSITSRYSKRRPLVRQLPTFQLIQIALLRAAEYQYNQYRIAILLPALPLSLSLHIHPHLRSLRRDDGISRGGIQHDKDVDILHRTYMDTR